MKKLPFLILFLLLFKASLAQYRFKHLGIAQGLSQNSVHCIFRDSEGFVWIGTQDGLNRYDGNSFITYRHSITDSTSISDDFIMNIAEDSRKNLWIGTRNGENRFDKKTERFQRIFSPGMDKLFFHNAVHIGFADSSGNIVFTSGDSIAIAKVDAATGDYAIDILRIPFLSSDLVCHDKVGNLFFLNQNGLYQFNYRLHANSTSVLISKKINRINHQAPYCLLSRNKTIWLCEKNGLTGFNTLSGEEQRIPMNDLSVIVAEEDRNGKIWIGGRKGITILHEDRISSTQLIPINEDERSLSGNVVITLYEDTSGLMWIGYIDKGLSIYNPDQEVFRTLGKNNASAIQLNDKSIWSICQEKKLLWIGTSAGLQKFRLQSDSFAGLKGIENITEDVKMMRAKDILKGQINTIQSNSDGTLWIGTREKGLALIDTNGQVLRQYTMQNSPLCSNTVFHLMRASNNTLWISTISGLNCLHLEDNKMEKFTSLKNDSGTLPANYIISTYEDSKKRIWISSTMGLSLYIPQKKKFKNYSSEYGNSSSLSYNIVTSSIEDREGCIWVSTLGGGINMLDEKKQCFKSFSIIDGLANNVVYGIMSDELGNLWMSTDKGISQFDRKAKTFRNFSKNDGLLSNEFCQNSFFKNSFGEFFWGTPEGLVIFNPSELSKIFSNPPIKLTSLSINYVKINPYEVLAKQELNLYSKDKTVTFEFTGIDFYNSSELKYAFMLEGFTNEWVTCNAGQRIASFTNLPFGDYVFKVRMMNANQEWSNALLKIQVHVIPPLWKTWWFKIISTILFIAILFLVVNYFSQMALKRKLREAEVQNKIQQERERISMDLHDHVGSHLTYITQSLDHISYKMKNGNPSVSEEKISDLSAFSREVMQQLRETIWAINREEISVDDLKNKIEEHLSKIVSGTGGIQCIVTNEMEFHSMLKPSMAIHVFRIVQECISNSLKHAHAKNLSVRFWATEEQKIGIEIKDDGEGMDVSIAHPGHYGMSNIKARIEEMEGKMDVQSAPGKGTTFTFFISI